MPQNLIFDADDTLWDNNVLFERAIEYFLDHLESADFPREHIRARLDEIEKSNSHRYGYGLAVFEHSLVECLTEFRGQPGETDQQVLRVACAPIRAQQVELLDGVLDTLCTLSQRHRLYLLTKGDHTEQTGKIETSGLAEFFTDIAIVREKETEVYRDFAAHRALPHTHPKFHIITPFAQLTQHF